MNSLRSNPPAPGSAVRGSIGAKHRGFSLVEVLVATAIFALVIVAAFTLYDMAQNQYHQGEAASDTQQNTRIGFEQLMSDLRMTGMKRA